MKKFFKNSGFTLFELLAVLAILAIVAGIAVPRVMQTITNSRITALESEMQLVASAVQRMIMDNEIKFSNNSKKSVHLPFYIGSNAVDGEFVGWYFDSTVSNITDPASLEMSAIQTVGAGEITGGSEIALNIEDYLEGGIPEHLYVFVYDADSTNDPFNGDKSGIANILVIYDDTLNPDNMYGNVTADDLTFEDELDYANFTSGLVADGDYDGAITNYIHVEVEYSGLNLTITTS